MKWSLLQNGIGIDIQAGTFQAICLKRQWKRIHVAGRLVIPQYQKLGPQQCGSLYREFLQKNGLKSPWTVVALPRSSVLLRWLSLPRAVEKDLGRAVEYQLDSLHPFEEGSVYWDAAYQKPSGSAFSGGGAGASDRMEVPVAIAEKKYVEETISWFRQAGIGVTQFTVTTAAILAALGPPLGLGAPAASHTAKSFFILNAGPESIELTGYAPGIASLSKEIPIAASVSESEHALLAVLERELELMRSELRLSQDDRPALVVCGKNLGVISPAISNELRFAVVPADSFFPSLSVGAENFELSEDIVAFAAALTAVDRTLPFSLNLLPPESRAYQSPLAYVPAYALSALIVLLALALGLRGTFQDWLYTRYLEREIQVLQPQLQQVERAQGQSRKAYERLALLGGIKSTATLPLEILNELTRILPEDVWLQQMQFDGDTLSLAGTAKSASQLLPTLAGSSYFDSPQFASAISKTADGKESFRIGVRLRKIR